MPDAAVGKTTLAIADAAKMLFIGPGETATWNGEIVYAADLIVKYTYAGDLNLDGLINGADYGQIDN